MTVRERYTFDETTETYSREQVSDPARRVEIEVGDAKQIGFLPQVKLLQWDNEANFSLRLADDDLTRGTLRETDDRIEWERAGRTFRAYDLPPNGPQFEDGGFELEVVLAEKPASNVLSFTVETKGLEFWFQPPLPPERERTEEEQGAFQPENVIGSYAVYHESKAGNRVGGKAYRTGKAFHIYRPKAHDRNGAETWCELHIDTEAKLLTVTVPQAFLDSASYPVTVDPTFGQTTIGAASTNHVYRGTTYTLPEDGDVTTIFWYGNQDTGTARNAIYRTSDLVRMAAHFTDDGYNAPAPDAWQSAALAVSLVAGDYGLLRAGSTSAGSPLIFYDAVSVHRYFWNDIWSGTNGWPSPWNQTQGTGSFRYSIYAEYTAAGGDTVSPDGALHAHVSGAPTLTQAHVLAAAGSLHGHLAEAPALTQAHVLAAQAALHAHIAGEAALTQANVLEALGSVHAHLAASPDLTVGGVLEVLGSLHAHIAGSPALVQAHALVVAGSLHGHIAEAAALTQASVLAAQGALHAHLSGEATVSEAAILAVADALHAHVSGSAGITQAHLLAAQGSLHGHTAGAVTLEIVGLLNVAGAVHAHLSGEATLTTDAILQALGSVHAHLSGEVIFPSHVVPSHPGMEWTLTRNRLHWTLISNRTTVH